MATAGRTVAVSGITVAVALASLMLFPETFLRSMGYGGVATVLVDMLAALTVMPALLAVLGPRVNALRVRRASHRPARDEKRGLVPDRAQRDAPPGGLRRGDPARAARPGAPRSCSVTWGGTDARALPAGAPARVVAEALNRDFPGNPASPIEVAGHARPARPRPPAQRRRARRLRAPPGSRARRLRRALTGVRGDIARVDLRYAADP